MTIISDNGTVGGECFLPSSKPWDAQNLLV